MKTPVRSSTAASSRDQGYALLTILVIGMSAITFLMTLASTMNAVFHEEGRRRNVEQLRVASEAGIDWAISQLNQAAQAGTVATIDVVPPQTAKTTTLPADYLHATMGSASNAAAIANLNVNVTVKMVPPPPGSSAWTTISHFSSIYNPQLDPANSVTTSWTHPASTNVTVDQWRILESTATTANATKTIRVILQPRHDPPPDPPGQPPSGTNNQPYFNYALSGNNAVTFAPSGGPLTVQGVGTASPAYPLQTTGEYNYYLSVNSNQTAAVGTGTDLKGNVQVSSQLTIPTNPTAQANQPPSGQNLNPLNAGVIEGRVTSNGYFSSSTGTIPWGTASTMLSTDNVLSNADQYSPAVMSSGYQPFPSLTYTSLSRQGVNTSQPTAQNLSGTASPLSQNLMAPAMTTAATTQFLDFSSLPVTGSTATLNGGQYQTTSLMADPSTGLSNPVSISGQDLSGNPMPTQIFVQRPLDPTVNTPVSISSNLLQNNSGTASNLQIWYSGYEPVNINVTGGVPFNGVIYAPNAPVTISGSGTFDGAVVGGSVNVTMNGTMNLQTDLTTPTGAQGSHLSYLANSDGSPLLTGYRAVTWEELK